MVLSQDPFNLPPTERFKLNNATLTNKEQGCVMASLSVREVRRRSVCGSKVGSLHIHGHLDDLSSEASFVTADADALGNGCLVIEAHVRSLVG